MLLKYTLVPEAYASVVSHGTGSGSKLAVASIVGFKLVEYDTKQLHFSILVRENDVILNEAQPSTIYCHQTQ